MTTTKTDRQNGCMCPSDCGCHDWNTRPNVCGCARHGKPARLPAIGPMQWTTFTVCPARNNRTGHPILECDRCHARATLSDDFDLDELDERQAVHIARHHA